MLTNLLRRNFRSGLLFLGSLSLASVILLISIFSVAKINYVFSQAPTPFLLSDFKSVSVDYTLPTAGRIFPDSPLWPIKALRDRIWTTFTFNSLQKANLNLLLADKRLIYAHALFQKGNPDLAISVLEKGEKYLEVAQKDERLAHSQGTDTSEFLQKYALATLKHRAMIQEMVMMAPEDAKPLVVKTENYSKHLFNAARDGILQATHTPPQNPFN